MASASDHICAGYLRRRPRRVAVCVHGPAIAPSASFASVARFVVAALGRASVSVILNVSVSDEAAAAHALVAARQHLPRSRISVGSYTSGDESRSELKARRARARCLPTAAAVVLSRAHEQHLDSRRRCMEDVAAREAAAGSAAAFDEVLYVPADHVWTRPLWPLCFHTSPRSRAADERTVRWHGRVWWARRALAEVVLARPAIDYWAQPSLRLPPPCAVPASVGGDPLTGQQHAADRLGGRRADLEPAAARDALGDDGGARAADEERSEERRLLQWIESRVRASGVSPVDDPSLAACVPARAERFTVRHEPRQQRPPPPPPCAPLPPELAAHWTLDATADPRLQLQRPCCAACRGVTGTTIIPSPPAAGSGADAPADADDVDGTVAAATAAVCGAAPPPRIALAVAGLARTFASALVHASIREHVIDALGGRTVGGRSHAAATQQPRSTQLPSPHCIRATQPRCAERSARIPSSALPTESSRCTLCAWACARRQVAFAFLRLEDRRGLTRFGSTDLSAVQDASNASVLAALRAIGAAPEDVVLVTHRDTHGAQTPHPGHPISAHSGRHRRALAALCARRTQVLTHSAMPPEHRCAQLPTLAQSAASRACQSYSDPCGMHAVVGQLWSRRAIFDMVVAHEARRGVRFDSILFVRPDLAALLPMLPWCYYDRAISRNKVDHAWWVSRADAAAALREPHDDVYQCRLRTWGRAELHRKRPVRRRAVHVRLTCRALCSQLHRWGRGAEHDDACSKVADRAFRKAELRPPSAPGATQTRRPQPRAHSTRSAPLSSLRTACATRLCSSAPGLPPSCRFGPELMMKARAAHHGAQLHDDPALMALALARSPQRAARTGAHRPGAPIPCIRTSAQTPPTISAHPSATVMSINL